MLHMEELELLKKCIINVTSYAVWLRSPEFSECDSGVQLGVRGLSNQA